MRVKRQLLVVCLLLLVTTLTACNRGRGVQAAREDRPEAVSQSERNFTMKAAQANLAEIEAARIALDKSDNNDVKAYANMIKNDHTSALEDLADLMKDKNVQQPRSIASDTQQDISRMSNLSGGEFDREFVNMMVSDHQKAIELFLDQQSSAQNPDVKNYVDEVLPKLDMHLDQAQRLQTKLFSAPNKPVSQPPTTR
jgi:putative membrane protein